MRPFKVFLYLSLSLMIGFLWQCASTQQTTLMQDEFEADSEIDAELANLFEYSDDEIKEELATDDDFMARLQAYEPEPTTTTPVEEEIIAPSASESEEESLQDVLALLLGDDDTDDSSIFPSTTPDQSTAFQEENSVINQFESYTLENDITQLENEFESKNAKVDSLRRLLNNKDSRIKELEAQKQSGIVRPQPKKQTAFSGPDPAFTNGYQGARSDFEAQNYEQARQAFINLLSSFPDHRMADNCQYWLGECYFGMKNYNQAISEFTKVFGYRQQDKYDDAQLMIALSYLRQGNRDQAKNSFDQFFNDYPDSEFIPVARKLYQKL